MIVIDPDETTHNIQLIPRYYNANANTFTIYNENTRTSSNLSNSKALSNGYATYTVTLSTTEGTSYSVKITDGTTVVWRGKLFATAQTTQNYRINE